MIYGELFWSFVKIGLFAVGGGYASMPLIQDQTVQIHHWLTMSELADIFALSQMTPGPIGINAATFVGMHEAGIMGAIAATLGFVTPSVFIMLFLTWVLYRYGKLEIIGGALNGLRAAVVALIGTAMLTFLTHILWQSGTIRWEMPQWGNFVLLLMALYFLRARKMGIMKTLFFMGLLGLLFGQLQWL